LPGQGSSLEPIICAFVDVSRWFSPPGGVATAIPPCAAASASALAASASALAPLKNRLIPSSSPMARVYAARV
jgi:hypothetical protein